MLYILFYPKIIVINDFMFEKVRKQTPLQRQVFNYCNKIIHFLIFIHRNSTLDTASYTGFHSSILFHLQSKPFQTLTFTRSVKIYSLNNGFLNTFSYSAEFVVFNVFNSSAEIPSNFSASSLNIEINWESVWSVISRLRIYR